MKSRDNNVWATVFAASIIIGCSIGSIRARGRHRVVQQKQLEEAVQTWEDEGGAFRAEEDDEERAAPAAR